MKKFIFAIGLLTLTFAASATNTTSNVDGACTVCASSSSGNMQCAASPDGCADAIHILMMFLE